MTEIKVGEASASLSPFEHPDLIDELNAQIMFLSHLYVPEEHRKQGHATALLKQLAEEADAAQTTLILNPSSEGEMEDKDLIKFYEKHGYATLQGDPHLMVRFPSQPNLQPKKATIAILDAYGNTFN